MNKALSRFILCSLLLPCSLSIGCAKQPATTEQEQTPKGQETEAASPEEISIEDFESGQIDDSQAGGESEEEDQGTGEGN